MSRNLDTIDFQSRNFYETARFKFFGSWMLVGWGLVCLGMVSCNASQAQYSYQQSEVDGQTDDKVDAYMTLRGSYGFSSFLYILGMILSFSCAIYVNPLLMGSSNEKSTLSEPMSISDGLGYQGSGSTGDNMNGALATKGE
jgi:hypothetical protein